MLRADHVVEVRERTVKGLAQALRLPNESLLLPDPLVRFVVTHTLRDASPEYWAQVERNIESELRRGTCLVLLDGLDEVGGDGDLSTVLREFVDEFSQNQFVLTSRIVGLDAGPWRKL